MRVVLTLAAVAAVATGLAAPVTVGSLAPRARALSEEWGALSDDFLLDVTYESEGSEHEPEGRRGWANWLVRDRLVLGQYPHCQPAEPGPSADDASALLDALVRAGVDCFASLQAELPPQDDDAAWPAAGVPLADDGARARFPRAFVRYAGEADALAGRPLRYLHCPITDLSVPSDGLKDGGTLLSLLDAALAHYEAGGRAIYVHCWGGRGRAGLVGACLLSLLRPELDAPAVLERVQRAYSSRAGAGAMREELQRSPQTEAQRQFVRAFVSAVRASRRFENDIKMKESGMPAGYM